MTRFVQALAVFAFVSVGTPIARADSKVDWSQFIEKPGDRPIVNKPAKVAQASPKAAKPAKAAKPKPKRAAKSKKR